MGMGVRHRFPFKYIHGPHIVLNIFMLITMGMGVRHQISYWPGAYFRFDRLPSLCIMSVLCPTEQCLHGYLMIGGTLRGIAITQIACHEYHSAAVAGTSSKPQKIPHQILPTIT